MINHINAKIKNRNRKSLSGSKLTKAAVLLPLIGKEPELRVLMTKRTQTVQVHKGQISFPGGQYEEKDRDLLSTAMRETQEEVGIQPEKIEILGCLDDIETITDYVITPFVGHIEEPPHYRIAVEEIDRVLEVPLDHLMEEENWKLEEHRRSDVIYRGFSCCYRGDKIWGATAQILKRFIDMIS